jgi:hypothetical protein
MYGHMVLTFYLGTAALEFKQYAAYVQRRTATRAASPEPDDPAADSTGADGAEDFVRSDPGARCE